jgi:putative membrane protein
VSASKSDSHSNPADERTTLAAYRTSLALDRTTLAWVRTTLTMASFGFGMVAFFRTLRATSPTEETRRLHEGAIAFGVALIVLGLAATVLAGAAHWLTVQKLRRGQTPGLTPWPLSITVAVLFVVVGLAGLWALLAR